MQYKVVIEGIGKGPEAGLLMHSAVGLDPEADQNREQLEITRKKGSDRTESENRRLRELDVEKSLWLDGDGVPTIPAAAIRSCIETAARKLKQGPKVREGLIVDSVDEFKYDEKRYGKTIEKLNTTTQFTVPVSVQRARVLRTRAQFETPWSCTFRLDCDDDLVGENQLRQWLDIAGRRIGLGDWRPERSGTHGRFKATSITTIDEEETPRPRGRKKA